MCSKSRAVIQLDVVFDTQADERRAGSMTKKTTQVQNGSSVACRLSKTGEVK
jgi:hypothetical protein